MPTSPRDPLLTAARLLLMAFIVVLGLTAAAILLALPFVIGFQDRILAELAKEGLTAGPEMIGAIALLMTGVFVLLGLAIYFVVLLRRIVLSVGEGDPFIPENASRLSRMGWLTLIGQFAALPVGAMILWIASVVEDSPAAAKAHFQTDLGLSPTAFLLALVLFILARVFRRGAEMRDELEGTV